MFQLSNNFILIFLNNLYSVNYVFNQSLIEKGIFEINSFEIILLDLLKNMSAIIAFVMEN